MEEQLHSGSSIHYIFHDDAQRWWCAQMEQATGTTIGGLISDRGRLEYFACRVPEPLVTEWFLSYKHIIGLVEMYAVLVALETWDSWICGERILIFVDNWPVVDALVKGTSGQATWRDMLMAFERIDERQQTLHWVCRVPSSSNPADPPSRGTVETIAFLKPFSICNGKCPLTNALLQSDVKDG